MFDDNIYGHFRGQTCVVIILHGFLVFLQEPRSIQAVCQHEVNSNHPLQSITLLDLRKHMIKTYSMLTKIKLLTRKCLQESHLDTYTHTALVL